MEEEEEGGGIEEEIEEILHREHSQPQHLCYMSRPANNIAPSCPKDSQPCLFFVVRTLQANFS